MEPYYFIVNPIAGSGRSERLFQEAEKRLTALGLPYRAVRTTRPLEATELARAALSAGERRIVAVGGDGTVNEVAAALCYSDAVMGMLPFGTGNDLAKVIPFPTEPQAALTALLEGRVRPMDAGQANGRLFLNVAGLGFDVAVLLATDKYKQRFRGMLPYLMGILESLAHLNTLHASIAIRTESGESLHLCQDSTIISVGNGAYIGGGMKALPEADPFDGLLDVSVVERVSTGRFLLLLPRFIRGRHLGHPIVKYYRAREISVSCPEGCRMQLDGEICGGGTVSFRVLPGALRMIVGG